MRRIIDGNGVLRVINHQSWEHIWDCICEQLGIQEA